MMFKGVIFSFFPDVEKCINAQDGPTDLIESGVKRRSRALCLKVLSYYTFECFI